MSTTRTSKGAPANRPSPVRRVTLAAALLVTLGLSAWTHWRQQRASEVVEARASAPAGLRSHVPTLPSEFGLAQPVGAEVRQRNGPDGALVAVNPFAVRSWAPPPPPPPPPPPQPPAPEPTAPALPFQYLGRQERLGSTEQTVFFLTRGGQVHAVAPGESLGSDYRFEGMEQGVLRFTYLPLSVSQELNIGIKP